MDSMTHSTRAVAGILLGATLCAPVAAPVAAVVLSGFVLWLVIGLVSAGLAAAAYELYSFYRLRPPQDQP